MSLEQQQQSLNFGDDDFEFVNADSIRQPSIDRTLNDSLVMHPMLISTSTLVEESNDERQSTPTNGLETAMHNASLASSNSSVDGMSAMLRTQAETQQMLEAQLQEFTLMQESVKASLHLQSKVDELSATNERLERQLAETNARLSETKTEARKEVDTEVRKKDETICNLLLQVASLEREKQAALNLQSKVDELSMTNVTLKLQLLDTDALISQAKVETRKEVDNELRQKDETISNLLLQVAALEKKDTQASLHLTSQVDELSTTNERLERQLAQTNDLLSQTKADAKREVDNEVRKKDETISNLLLQVAYLEREQRESQVLHRTTSLGEVEKLRQENAALKMKIEGLSAQFGEVSLENQQAIEGYMVKSGECEQQLVKIRQLESELSNTRAASLDNDAIISTLREVNEEGSKMLDDYRRKVETMKRTLEKYGNFSDF